MKSPKIKRALISVHDKDRIIEFARGLRQFEIEILSTDLRIDVYRASDLAYSFPTLDEARNTFTEFEN